MSEKDSKITSSFTAETVKVIAESIGISNLPDDAATETANDCTYRLKIALQEAIKFMHHAKHQRLSTSDFDQALRCQNIEPLYGVQSAASIPFRYASGGGRELHFTEDRDYDLNDVIVMPLPKIPHDVSIKPHWLSIDGAQPATADNPPSLSKDAQKEKALNISEKPEETNPRVLVEKQRHKSKLRDISKIKDIAIHDLSVEQQLFYKEITEACVGSNENRRTEALHSLATDPGIHQMLPRFSLFVSEGVKINVAQHNLALLIYLMRMVKAIMDNPTLYLDKYLHEILPAVLTCIVSNQLCMRPDIDNHWALRDFAARLMGQLCRSFSTSVNNAQARVTKTFSNAVQNEKLSLATNYGAIGGLGELGNEVVKTFLMPHLKTLSNRIQSIAENPQYSNNDRNACDHIKRLLVKYIAGVLRLSRPISDTIEDYVRDYGSLGTLLHAGVIHERLNNNSRHIKNQSRIQPVMNTSISSVNLPRTPSTVGGNQKFVFLSQTRGAPGSQLRPITTTNQSFMKILTSSSVGVSPQTLPHSQSSTQKIVVLPVQKSTSTVASASTASTVAAGALTAVNQPKSTGAVAPSEAFSMQTSIASSAPGGQTQPFTSTTS